MDYGFAVGIGPHRARGVQLIFSRVDLALGGDSGPTRPRPGGTSLENVRHDLGVDMRTDLAPRVGAAWEHA